MGIRRLIDFIRGPFKTAKKKGMVVEGGVTVMSGVNFGSEPYLITLKKNCRISSNVVFINHDGGTWAFRNLDPKYSEVVKFGEIVIGENAFIGAGTIILPGVHIGNNSVIGAGSVVTKDIPDNTVVCGVPAKIICSLDEYRSKCLSNIPNDFDFKTYKKDKKRHLIDVFRKNN